MGILDISAVQDDGRREKKSEIYYDNLNSFYHHLMKVNLLCIEMIIA